MLLNDPEITLSLMPYGDRDKADSLTSKFDFWQFFKADYFCIDGFPTEGMPGVVVLPAPYRGNYVY